MFWLQNRGSSIWGSRDIKRLRTRHAYYKMTKKFFWGGGSESKGHETWRNEKKFFDFWTDYHIFRCFDRKVKKKDCHN